jgi:hypothetical protein
MTQTTIDNDTGAEVAPLTTVAEYNAIAAGIAMMLEKHGKVLTNPPVVTGDATALATVKASRQELVKFRTGLESARVAAKAASLAYGKLVDTEAKRIQAFAAPLELAYDAIVTAEETRLEAIRQAELEAERQRIAGHRARIQAIKDVRETANMCRTAERIKQLIDGMPALFEGTFEEFQDEALTAFNEVCTVLGQLHDTKVEAELAAAELKRQQDALAAQQAEADRKAAIQTKLTAIRMLLVSAASMETATAISAALDWAKAIQIDDSYAEFKLEADNTLDSVCEQLATMLTAKQQAEAAAADLKQRELAAKKRQDDLDEQARQQTARETAHQAEQQAQASKPLVARVAQAITGPRPTFANIGEVTAAVLGAEHPVAQAMKEPAPRRFSGRSELDRPDDEDIVIGLAEHFDCTEAEAVAWLRDMDLDGVTANLQQVAA